MDYHKISIIQVLEEQEGKRSTSLIGDNVRLQSLERNTRPDLRRIIIIQLPRYVHHEKSRLTANTGAVSKLGKHLSKLGLPNRILEDHVATENHPFRFSENFRTLLAPSERYPGQSFTIKYYEARTFDAEWSQETRSAFRNPTTGEFEFTCANTGHQIQVHEWHEEVHRGPLMVVPRNVSFWCKMGARNNWDGEFTESSVAQS